MQIKLSIISEWFNLRKCGGSEKDEANVCGGSGTAMDKRIVYAWALNAPSKALPDGVGLRVGGDTDIQYMVLQLHYKEKFPGRLAGCTYLLYVTLNIMLYILLYINCT